MKTAKKRDNKPPSYDRLGKHLAILFGDVSFSERIPGAVLELYPWVGDAFDVLREVYYPEDWRVYLNQDEDFAVITAEPFSVTGADLAKLAALEHLGFDVRISGYAPKWPGERVLVAIGKRKI